MLGDGQVRFGGRSAETEQPKGHHRAAGRPYNLTERQQQKLAWITKLNAPIYRAYLLKEQLRQIYHVPHDQASGLLDAWLKWARRCRLQPFVKLAKTITEQRERVEAALTHNLSNARVEQVNTQIRLITRRGFGYHSPFTRRRDRTRDAHTRRPLPAPTRPLTPPTGTSVPSHFLGPRHLRRYFELIESLIAPRRPEDTTVAAPASATVPASRGNDQ
jgi:Transposase